MSLVRLLRRQSAVCQSGETGYGAYAAMEKRGICHADIDVQSPNGHEPNRAGMADDGEEGGGGVVKPDENFSPTVPSTSARTLIPGTNQAN